MSTLLWIIVASLGGGLVSITFAGLFSFVTNSNWVPILVSYAVGALLGAVFIEILPYAIEISRDPHELAFTILIGILLFFVLEKLVLWRHCHTEHCEAHDAQPTHSHNHHDHGRSGMMVMIGDTMHNFVDGIIIAAAFMADTQLGIVTSVAIVAHEIPQEVGDFMILRHSGYSKAQAFAFNLVSSLATVIGGVIAYFSLYSLQRWIPSFLGIAAASMLYVAVADLIPGLHKKTELKSTSQQVFLIALGVATIYFTHLFLGSH